MGDFKLTTRPWWNGLEYDLRELLNESVLLIENATVWKDKFHDYSFVVFPAAKAYEGFLKGIFLKKGFIGRDDYFGRHFRIGKALNPNLDERYRGESVYDKISDYCNNTKLADLMWDTWKQCRNLLFHWFPDEKKAIDIQGARERVMKIISTMDEIYKGCKMDSINKKVKPKSEPL